MAEYIKTKTSTGEIRWRVRVVIGHDENGKAKCQMKTWKTRRDAEVWAREMETLVDQHMHANPGKLTVDAFLTDWLTEWDQHVRESTLAGYKKLVDLYVRPRLHGLRLADAKALALQRLLNELPTTGVKLHVKRVLHIAFEHAVDLGLLASNPVDRIKAPQHHARQSKAWSVAEARRFLARAEQDGYQPYWTLALCTGARPSELLALTWADVDLTRGTLAISHARPTVGSATFAGDPKSQAGKRDFTLAPTVMGLLKAHKTRQNARRLELGPAWTDNNLVCASSVGTHIALRNLSRRLTELCKEAGVQRLSPRELRHTAISLMVDAGDDIKAISQVVGHSDPRLTVRVYQHPYEHQRTKALAGLAANLLGGADRV